MNDFDKLKDLLFGAEKEALHTIAQRVERRETRTTDVAAVLAEAIHQSHNEDSRLVESLNAPVTECLQQSFRKDPQTYGDALYPVMGPAIRKSIAHTLKEFSQQINQALEHSFTLKGLKWRLQASRAGIPLSDFVMQKTLLYRVEQAYLISRENGLLIEHVHHAASKIKDSDAVSAMFTAIQDFVKESFSPDRTGRLESADMGEFTLWAVHGPHALLVCVIRGIPPNSLRNNLSAVLERIHFRYGDVVREYDGNTESVRGIDAELDDCLTFQATQNEGEGKSRGKPWPLIIVSLIALCLLGYGCSEQWSATRELRAFEAALRQTPGLFISEVAREKDQIVVRGMRDPLSESVSEIASQLGISEASIVAEMKPYHSLDSDIVKGRVEQSLGAAADVNFEVSGTVVTVYGEAPGTWIDAARDRVLNVAGIEGADFTNVVDSDLGRLENDIQALSGTVFRFVDGIRFQPGQELALRQFAQQLAELQGKTLAYPTTLQITLIGSTDAIGSDAVNKPLGLRRAEVTAAILTEFGISPNQLLQTTVDPSESVTGADFNRRSVQFEIRLSPQIINDSL